MEQKWEYDRKIIEFKSVKELIDELNTFGADGWEIINYEETKPKKFGEKRECIVVAKRLKTKVL
jgi:hypothetical protein